MVSIRLKFRPSTVLGKTGTLYYQIIHNSKVKHIVSSHRIYPFEWNREQSFIVETAFVGDRERRLALKDILGAVDRDMRRLNTIVERLEAGGGTYSVEDIVELFHAGEDSMTLCSFTKELTDRFRSAGKIRLSETYSSALGSFLRFRGGRDIQFCEIVPSLMEDYQDYLRGCGLSMNTVSFYLRILRAVYNRAVNRGLTEMRSPFRTVYTGVARTVKRAVPLEVIKSIRDLRLSEGGALIFSRDIFMLSFYTRGMSFVDMAYLRKSDLKNGVLTYRRRKTGQRLSIRWEQCMQEIVDRYSSFTADSTYLLPIIKNDSADDRKQYKNALFKVNRKLKEIGRLAGLSHPLTMYVARHSWASIARSRNIPLHVISEGLGHDSDKTTYIYLASIEASEVDEANREILGLL